MSTATNSPPPKPPSKPTGGKPVKPAKKSSTIPPAPPTNIVGTTAPQNTTSMPSNRSPPKKAAKPTTPPKSSNPFDDDDDNHDSCDNNNSNNSNGNGSDARRGGGSRGGDVAMTSFVNPVAAATSTTSTANNSNNSNLLKNKNINSKKVMNYNYNAKASKIYDKVNVAEFWILVFVVVEVLQCSTLVHVGRSVLPQGIYIFLWVLTFTIALCCVLGRVIIKRKPYFNWLKEPNSPEDETEQNLTVVSIYLFCIAAILEGVFFAIFSAVVAGNDTALPPSGNGYTNRETLLETLRFASITLLFLHRIIRPANRLDPARTMLELEIVSVCWDALDGSTLYELLDTSSTHLSPSEDTATRLLMGVWYMSVGLRLAFMFTVHLPPHNYIYQLFNVPPLSISDQPTVDRTMQALRLRSVVIFIMTAAEIYAIILRFTLWTQGKLDPIQQEMCIKNILFVGAAYSAYSLYMSSKNRDWNSRDLGFGFKIPTRIEQHWYSRAGFAFSYLLLGSMLSSFLIQVASVDRFTWTCNVASDLFLVLIFLIYCPNVHLKTPSSEAVHDSLCSCIFPKKSYVVFPGYLGMIMGILLAGNMFLARLPALYYNYANMNGVNSWTSYDNATLLISCSVVPIALYAQYWSVSYMLYNKEFTACPGNHNSIHDPSISMVSMSTITEGALDILSCAQFMNLAADELPSSVNGFIVLFCCLEIINGCQSFALQGILSGGKGDTPNELIGWKAHLRGFRGVIDLGCFILRVVLWVHYHAVSSVFLIKNLYNLLHTYVEVERAWGIKNYPKGTLFTEFVPPQDWYGMDQNQWRIETSETIAAQAAAGRRV